MNKKRILIVTRAFYPDISPRSFRATELAKEFARQGHEVTVITKHREEDVPILLRLTKAGYNLSFMPKETVKYRIHSDSISQFKSQNNIYTNFAERIHQTMFREYIMPYLPIEEQIINNYNYVIMKIFRNTFLNERNFITKALNKTLLLPYSIANRYFRNRITKNIKRRVTNI